MRLADIPVAGGNGANGGLQLTKEESQDGLFISDEDEEESGKKTSPIVPTDKGGEDDKKKLSLNTTYDGFSIYGRILCLVVKRRGMGKGKEMAGSAGPIMVEDWIASTQMRDGQLMDD